MEGIDEGYSFQSAAVLHVFGEEGLAAGTFCGGDQKRVEELEMVLLMELDGCEEIFGGVWNDFRGFNCSADDFGYLRDPGKELLPYADGIKLAQALQWQKCGA